MSEVARIESSGESPARFTVDQFMELVNSDVFRRAGKLELVEGVIVRMSPALSPHMLYQRQLFRSLDAIFGDGLDGYIVQFELSLQLGNATLRDADIGVIKAFDLEGRFPDPATALLIVEIAHSSLDKDMNAKRIDYARVAIPHYWVVDVEGKRVHAMTTPVDGDYAERTLHVFGTPIPVPGTDRTITVQ